MKTKGPFYKALIVDDEKLARANISYAISEFKHWTVVDECSRGDVVLEFVDKKKPDVVFLDIKMPGITGMEVCKQLQELASPPIIIFVTAFDSHAVEAFEFCAFDYLLKPFDDERFAKTMNRVEQLLESHQNQKQQLEQLEHISQSEKQDNISSSISQLTVRSMGKIQFIRIEEIQWISTAGNYLVLHVSGKEILHRVSLNFLLKHLTDGDFMRVHRTAVVRISEIIEFLTIGEAQYAAVLKSGEKVSVSHAYKDDLLERLDRR